MNNTNNKKMLTFINNLLSPSDFTDNKEEIKELKTVYKLLKQYYNEIILVNKVNTIN